MKKLILALTTALFVTIACGASATPIPTFDPGTIQTAIFSTAWAVFYKLKSAQFIIEKVPTLKVATLKLLSKRGPLYY